MISTYCPDAEVSLNISVSTAAGVWLQPSTGQQHLETNPTHEFNFDENKFKAIMKHESLHLTNQNDLESQNIINTSKTTEFKSSSKAFKDSQVEYLVNVWNNEDYSLNRDASDARRALGL